MKMKSIIFLITIAIYSCSKAQNIKVIDAIPGVGDFKWGMTNEQVKCKEDKYGFCNLYPGNFFIGGFSVSKISIAFNEHDYNDYVKGLYFIKVELNTSSKTDFEQIVKELKVKYGTPTKSSNEGDEICWYGNFVEVRTGYFIEKEQLKIVLVYSKKSNKTQVGF